MPVDHPDVVKSWIEVEDAGPGQTRRIAMVVAHIVTDPRAEGWDSSTVDDIIDATRQHYGDCRVRIIPGQR